MLILSRKMQQEIVLPDLQIVIRVLEIKSLSWILTWGTV